MRKTEDCSAFKWADGMHLLPELVGGMRGPAFAGNAAGSPPGGIGGPGTEAGVGRRTQEGHGSDSLAEANRIHGAALDGQPGCVNLGPLCGSQSDGAMLQYFGGGGCRGRLLIVAAIWCQ